MFPFRQQWFSEPCAQSHFPAYQQVTWLNDSNGIIHNFLGLFGITLADGGQLGEHRIASIRLWDWISGPSVTMLMIMILNIWTTTGTMMVIFLAALQNIPNQVYEAAYVDGANAWQIFRKITVPLLRPTTFFVITIGLIGTFQVFDQVFVITNGGPADTTLTIAYLVYASGFTDARMGQAAATAIVLFGLSCVYADSAALRRRTGDHLREVYAMTTVVF
jgi:multiple sugar transport system permease protein